MNDHDHSAVYRPIYALVEVPHRIEIRVIGHQWYEIKRCIFMFRRSMSLQKVPIITFYWVNSAEKLPKEWKDLKVEE
jgi:hypothetical protein